MELGEYNQAREAYSRALELDPHNTIAQKNLKRLALLEEVPPSTKGNHRRIVPQLFIEDMGKVGVVDLCNPAPREVLAKMASGDEVYLRPEGQKLVVENGEGEYLGQVEPRHELRLLRLMEGGNKYAAAIASVAEEGVKVIIKETFRHPSQEGRLSFPLRDAESFRPYVRDTFLRREVEEEELGEEAESALGWEEEGEGRLIPEGFSLVGETALEVKKDDLSEEE